MKNMTKVNNMYILFGLSLNDAVSMKLCRVNLSRIEWIFVERRQHSPRFYQLFFIIRDL